MSEVSLSNTPEGRTAADEFADKVNHGEIDLAVERHPDLPAGDGSGRTRADVAAEQVEAELTLEERNARMAEDIQQTNTELGLDFDARRAERARERENAQLGADVRRRYEFHQALEALEDDLDDLVDYESETGDLVVSPELDQRLWALAKDASPEEIEAILEVDPELFEPMLVGFARGADRQRFESAQAKLREQAEAALAPTVAGVEELRRLRDLNPHLDAEKAYSVFERMPRFEDAEAAKRAALQAFEFTADELRAEEAVEARERSLMGDLGSDDIEWFRNTYLVDLKHSDPAKFERLGRWIVAPLNEFYARVDALFDGDVDSAFPGEQRTTKQVLLEEEKGSPKWNAAQRELMSQEVASVDAQIAREQGRLRSFQMRQNPDGSLTPVIGGDGKPVPGKTVAEMAEEAEADAMREALQRGGRR